MGGDNVMVAVRVRPFSPKEIDAGEGRVVSMPDMQTVEVNDGPRKFSARYDYALWSHSDEDEDRFQTQAKVFEKVGMPLVKHALDGYNATLFAYGQTGSGKTHTMMGVPDDVGVIPRLCKHLFEGIAAYRKEHEEKHSSTIEADVELSLLELYNEVPYDLLVSSRKGLEVREHPILGPYVDKLSKFLVKDSDDMLQLLDEGAKLRTVAATSLNHVSSRSHCLCIITLTLRKNEHAGADGKEAVTHTCSSRLSLVDLAGSERSSRSNTKGARLVEGAHINKSLTTLGMVIRHLGEGRVGTPPYRNSKLTFLLSHALGGNSKTAMLAAVSPAACNVEETISTLRYASETKKIVTKAVVNEDSNTKLIRVLQQQIEELKSKLFQYEEKASVGDMTARGQRQTQENLAGLMAMLEESSRPPLSHMDKESMRNALDREHASAMEALGIRRDAKLNQPHLAQLDADVAFQNVCYELTDGDNLIGFADGCQVLLCGAGVLAEHAIISVEDAAAGEVYIVPVHDEIRERSKSLRTPRYDSPRFTSPPGSSRGGSGSPPMSARARSETLVLPTPRFMETVTFAKRGSITTTDECSPRSPQDSQFEDTIPDDKRCERDEKPQIVADVPILTFSHTNCQSPEVSFDGRTSSGNCSEDEGDTDEYEWRVDGCSFVNGEKLVTRTKLQDGDRVIIGSHVFRFANPKQAVQSVITVDWHFAVKERKREQRSGKRFQALMSARSQVVEERSRREAAEQCAAEERAEMANQRKARAAAEAELAEERRRRAEAEAQLKQLTVQSLKQPLKVPAKLPRSPRVIPDDFTRNARRAQSCAAGLLSPPPQNNNRRGSLIDEPVKEVISENERWFPFAGWSKPIKNVDPPHWTDEHMTHNVHGKGHVEQEIKRYGGLPWVWQEKSWRVVMGADVDNDGWKYYKSFDDEDQKTPLSADGRWLYVRRRLWYRHRYIPQPDE